MKLNEIFLPERRQTIRNKRVASWNSHSSSKRFLMREWISLIESENLNPAETVEEEFLAQLSLVAPHTKVSLNSQKPDVLELVHIDVENRGQGEGSRALELLCTLADKYNVTLELYVATDPEDGFTVSDLVNWYESYGFEIQTNLHMVRFSEFDVTY
jgi:hypothetical protein